MPDDAIPKHAVNGWHPVEGAKIGIPRHLIRRSWKSVVMREKRPVVSPLLNLRTVPLGPQIVVSTRDRALLGPGWDLAELPLGFWSH